MRQTGWFWVETPPRFVLIIGIKIKVGTDKLGFGIGPTVFRHPLNQD